MDLKDSIPKAKIEATHFTQFSLQQQFFLVTAAVSFGK